MKEKMLNIILREKNNKTEVKIVKSPMKGFDKGDYIIALASLIEYTEIQTELKWTKILSILAEGLMYIKHGEKFKNIKDTFPIVAVGALFDDDQVKTTVSFTTALEDKNLALHIFKKIAEKLQEQFGISQNEFIEAIEQIKEKK